VDSTQFWSGKFWLRPYHNESDLVFTASSDPRHAQTLDRWIHEHATHLPYDGQFYRSNVYCLFKMQEVDTPEHAHLTIRGDYFGAGYTNAYQNGILPDFTGVFQSGILNDIDFPSRHSHTRPHQRQYLHEIGHAIGLRHIGYEHHVPACAEVGGADQAACYYGAHVRDERNVMGAGELLSVDSALPWRHAMQAITGQRAYLWTPMMHYIPPSRIHS
jgi:hypothetical protein